MAIRSQEGPLMEAIAAAQEAPGPLQAFHRWTQTEGASRQEQFAVWQLAELQRARIDRELSAASPSQVLETYQRALQDPHSPENNVALAFIETRYRDGWQGLQPASEAEILRAVKLTETIEAARLQRVPEPATRALDTLKAARKAAQYARDVHKLSPVQG
jgi:hypothetical protein